LSLHRTELLLLALSVTFTTRPPGQSTSLLYRCPCPKAHSSNCHIVNLTDEHSAGRIAIAPQNFSLSPLQLLCSQWPCKPIANCLWELRCQIHCGNFFFYVGINQTPIETVSFSNSFIKICFRQNLHAS